MMNTFFSPFADTNSEDEASQCADEDESRSRVQMKVRTFFIADVSDCSNSFQTPGGGRGHVQDSSITSFDLLKKEIKNMEVKG